MKIIDSAFLLQVLEKHIDGDYDSRTAKHQAIRFARSSNPVATQPLNILACGDSWFDYPLDGYLYGPHTDVLSQITDITTVKPDILSLAHFGYTSTQELGFQRQQMLMEALKDQRNGRFDCILMSAGGNDIAGDALCIWLNDARSVTGVDKAINVVRFQAVLDCIKASYLDLIAIRDEFLPGAPIFAHSYDYPVVSGIGVCGKGPWLKPSLEYCGWNAVAGGIIVVQMMMAFASMLDSLVSDDFIHVRTQGTVGPTLWANELHPNPEGFKLLGHKFVDEMLVKFPGRL